MVSKQHCPICGFLMMYSLVEGEMQYVCVNVHEYPEENQKITAKTWKSLDF